MMHKKRVWGSGVAAFIVAMTAGSTMAWAAVTAQTQTVTIDEDTTAGITLTAMSTDPEEDTFTYEIVQQPSFGTIMGNPTAGEIEYVPDPNFHGTDVIWFKAKGTKTNISSGPARVFINVNPINDMPTALSQSVTVAEGGSVQVSLAANDVDGDFLSYKIVTRPEPTTGTLDESGVNDPFPSVTYTANTGVGTTTDEFTFTASDGPTTSDEATVSIIIGDVNQQPTGMNTEVSIDEDATASITFTAVDPEGVDPLEYIIVTQPANGTFEGQIPDLTYKPKQNFYGTEIIQWKAKEPGQGGLESPVYTVKITVNPINDLPVFLEPPTPAEGETVMASEGVELSLAMAANDPDPMDQVTYTMTGKPDGASFDMNTGIFTWTPAPTDANKTFDVKVAISDGSMDEMGALNKVERTFKITVARVDTDGDGVPDPVEEKWRLDPTRKDTDGDGIPDGVEFGNDFENPLDTDGDNNIDALDQDSDGDGIPDLNEVDAAGLPIDTDGDLIPNYRDPDSDNDMTNDNEDNCPLKRNTDQADLDNDGQGDVCDDDIDGDGVLNSMDSCKTVAGDASNFGCAPRPPKQEEEGCASTGMGGAPAGGAGLGLLALGALVGFRRRRS